ncbi:MAG TPA: hypothetical protein VFU55_11250 [Terracidiphilus sp.]|nr:hypothetical protein [Terracidiphilus sp.]
MTPLEQDIRWEQIWNVASLDATALLCSELNFPIELERFQSILRPLLSRYYSDNEFGKAAGRLHFLMSSALRAATTQDEERQFFLWGERIFDLGSDRTAEFFWLSVVHDLEEVIKPDWIEDVFAKIRKCMEDPRDALEVKIHAIGLRLSELDKSILGRIDMAEESLATCFSLTGEYNVFTKFWRAQTLHFSIEELSEIYRIGKKLAEKRNIPETAVTFPGTWDFGMPQDSSVLSG